MVLIIDVVNGVEIKYLVGCGFGGFFNWNWFKLYLGVVCGRKVG